MSFDRWKASGKRWVYDPVSKKVSESGPGVSVFIHVSGREGAPWCTFLHGYPTSSMDWAAVMGQLGDQCRTLTFDFVGFGDSDKPRDYAYSTFDRADLVAAIWKFLGVRESFLVAHDFADDVGLELLLRQKQGQLQTLISKAVFLNGGIYAALHRPTLGQKILLRPWAGWVFSRYLMNQRIFSGQFSKIFSKAHPVGAGELEEIWRSIQNRAGHRIHDRLIHYITERKTWSSRWAEQIANPGEGVELKLIWGLEDPVSGKHMLDEIRRNAPGVKVLELPDVGHYPQLEVPDGVSRELRELFVTE